MCAGCYGVSRSCVQNFIMVSRQVLQITPLSDVQNDNALPDSQKVNFFSQYTKNFHV